MNPDNSTTRRRSRKRWLGILALVFVVLLAVVVWVAMPRFEAVQVGAGPGRTGKESGEVRDAGVMLAGCGTDSLLSCAGFEARELTAGTPASGTLSARSRTFTEDGTAYEYWYYDGKRRETVVFTMRSTTMNAYLIVTVRDQVLADDDDSGGGTDAEVRLTLPEDGLYLIVANGAAKGDLGGYTLHVESDRQ